jgi:hypothetical protein
MAKIISDNLAYAKIVKTMGKAIILSWIWILEHKPDIKKN